MENIRLNQLLGKLGYRVCGGTKYHSNCYGKNARLMRFGDDDNLIFGECVFNTNDLNIYELSFLQGKDEKGQTLKYVWRHPDYKAAYRKEAALLRETKNYVELPYKQMSLDGVLDSLLKSLDRL